jgi:hypothetical protein
MSSPAVLERVRQSQRRELQELRCRRRPQQPDLFQEETSTDTQEEEAQIRRRFNYGYDPHD